MCWFIMAINVETLLAVASAKGCDAYCMLLAGADEFPTVVQGWASVYVPCTRAIEYLDVFASNRTGLAVEMEEAFATMD